ncbi:MAG: succinyl-diaminopimelate desuccinylase [Pseudomonadota bacterium]
MTELPDPVALTQALIRCPSVTPEEGGALGLLAETLAPFGFDSERIDVEGIPNLWTRWGRGRPLFCFAGHTDVVPVGDQAAWSEDPFSGALRDGLVWGRGATDMKSGVAAFVAAACRFVRETPPDGSIALLITGDEEGDAVYGTRAVLERLAARGEAIDAALVGEPTSVERLGDVVKIGRRGSLTAYLTATGEQGHTAYPHRARNPLPALARLLDRLASTPLDAGTDHFEASTLALTTIDVGNPANNVIPARGRATLNIRFNDGHDGASLIAMLERVAGEVSAESGVAIGVETKLSGEAFLTPPGPLSEIVSAAVEAETGARPALATGGGTSDARFIKDYCPVIECGLTGRTMHQVDERAPAAEIEGLAKIYRGVLARYFTGG